MASAAQLAARKKFSAIMKSGGFGAKKKKPAAKRKKNPAAARAPGTTPRQTLNRAGVRESLAGRQTQSARFNTPSTYAEVVRRGNPIAHRKPSGFHVHIVTGGAPGKLLGTFTTKPLAVEYAEGYAHKHNRQLCIVGKK